MFGGICLFCLFIFPLQAQHTSSCQDKLLTADTFWKVFTSPQYPQKFPKQTQCNWIIRAPVGYRVELKFDVFYLLGTPGAPKGCNVQHITLRDPLSEVTDGRYCGNTLPPSAVSTGRRLRLRLESNAIRLPQKPFYRGFRAQFRASRQASSLRLRDDRGAWQSYQVVGGDVIVTSTTTAATLPTRDPKEVDANNNAAIDERNNAVNNRNVNNNEIANRNNNEFNHPEEEHIEPAIPSIRPRYTTTRWLRPLVAAGKPLPTRRTNQIYLRPTISPKTQNIPGNDVEIRMNDDIKKKPKTSEALIIGAVVGGIIAILLIILAIWCVVRKRKKKESRRKKSKRRYQQNKKQRQREHKSYAMEVNSQPNKEAKQNSRDKIQPLSRRKELPRQFEHENFIGNPAHYPHPASRGLHKYNHYPINCHGKI